MDKHGWLPHLGDAATSETEEGSEEKDDGETRMTREELEGLFSRVGARVNQIRKRNGLPELRFELLEPDDDRQPNQLARN